MVFMYTILNPYSSRTVIDYLLTLRTEPDVCPEPMFSRAKQTFFFTDPHEVCEGLLLQIIVKPAINRISCRMRGEGPHLVYLPVRRLERKMKHAKTGGKSEMYDVLCRLGRTLGAAGGVG